MSKIVVKVGTSTLTQGTKKLSHRYMRELARQIAALHEKGDQVILVTSGAVAAGREVLQDIQVDRSLPVKQMLSAIGQVKLMQTWSELFALYEMQVGQVLLTREDFSDRNRYLNARDTLGCLLQHHVLPIINENDTVATKEIRVGDNDNLAALVATLLAADLLILLTDQEGLFTADPRINPQATLITEVKKIDESLFALARGSSTLLGTGGMTTKLEAAKIATQCGTPAIIASSAHPDVLLEIADGKHIGTRFSTEITPHESRKRWLLAEKRQGTIHVDNGAATKLSTSGASLLPSGITRVDQVFDRGSVVTLVNPDGKPFAIGITNYDNEEIKRLMGSHSNAIEEILGYSYGAEVIHRNNMVRLT